MPSEQDDLSQLQEAVRRYAARAMPNHPPRQVRIDMDGERRIVLPIPEPPPAPPPRPAPAIPDPWHSEDYRTVRWRGEEYAFTPIQAAAVRLLWEAWEDGAPALTQADLLRDINSECTRLRDLFRNHPSWNTLITPDGRGGYALAGWE